MPEQWDDDGQRLGGDPSRAGSPRGAEADRRDAEADEREAEADRRELRIDARELVLDRWEQEIAARAEALGLLDEVGDRVREQHRRDRTADGHARRDQAEARRDAAIERDIRRAGRGRSTIDPPVEAGAAAGLTLPPSFGELSAALVDDAPVTTVFGLVLAAVVDSVAGCAAATVALRTNGKVEVAATTAPWAADLDERQVALGAGPLVAAMAGDPVLTSDLGADGRWPGLADMGQARGRPAMAFGLRVGGNEIGAMTVYGERGGRLGPEAAATGEFLAALTTVALARSFERLTYEAQAQGWQSALSSRDAIGQAKGVLMEQRAISADEAFDLLRVASQRLNQKVRDIAVHLVEHRQMPPDME